MFLPEYGAHRHNLRNDLIRLPAIELELEYAVIKKIKRCINFSSKN